MKLIILLEMILSRFNSAMSSNRSKSHSSPSSASANRSCGLFRWCLGLPLAAVLIAALAIGIPIYSQYKALAPRQVFALITAHNSTAYPPSSVSRYRGLTYSQFDRFYFQWWNFLIFDADTNDHWNMIYQINNFSTRGENNIHTPLKDEIYSAFLHGRGSNKLISGKYSIPLLNSYTNKEFDLKFPIHEHLLRENNEKINNNNNNNNEENSLNEITENSIENNEIKNFELIVINSNQYRIIANFHSTLVDRHIPVRWNLIFHREHGIWNGENQEISNIQFCLLVSYLFSYNSRVTGIISEGDQNYYINSIADPNNSNSFISTLDRGIRYRAYAAGSYGCQLPNGSPASKFPWTWFWLIIPNEDPEKEIGIVTGTAKFSTGFPLGNLFGGFSSIGIGRNIISSQFGRIFYDSPFDLSFQMTSSDSFLTNFTVETSDWVEFIDEFGRAEIPLKQIYRIETANYTFSIDWSSRLDQYFRAPVPVEDLTDGSLRVFSDFRAVGVTAELSILKRLDNGGSNGNGNQGDSDHSEYEIIFEGKIDKMNALEFAYEPTVDLELYKQKTMRMSSNLKESG